MLRTIAVRALIVALVAVLCMPTFLISQNPPVNALSMVSPIPAPPAGIGAAQTGFVGQGQTLYYWVAARYPGGISVPQGPAVVPDTAGVGNLTATRFVTIQWYGVSGATGYDVLRNVTPQFPANPICTGCSVALNTTALSVVDNGGALGAYPPAGTVTATSAVVTMDVNNQDFNQAIVQVHFPNGNRFLPTLNTIPPAGQFPVFGAGGSLNALAVVPTTCPTCELLANKNVASGYAGLSAGVKLLLAQGQEVWALADLTDVASKVGNSTAVQMAGAGAPALNDCAKYDANGNVVTNGLACVTAASMNLSGTYAALPGAGTAGRMYFPTDSPYTHLRDNGVSWDHFRHGVQVTPPVDASFTWANQETATVTTTSGAVVLLAPANAGQDDRLRLVAPPARPFTVTLGMIVQQIPTQFPSAGLVLRDSVGGDYVELMFWNNTSPTICVASWNNFNAFAGCLGELNTVNPRPNNVEVWARVAVAAGAGGNRVWSISYDGVNYITLGSAQWDTFIGALDQVGFATQPQNATFPSSITVFHWLVTTP